MQTIVDIPDDLYEQADSMATKEGIALRDLITQGLRVQWSDGISAGDVSSLKIKGVPTPLAQKLAKVQKVAGIL